MLWITSAVLLVIVLGLFLYNQNLLKSLNHKDVLMERASQALETAKGHIVQLQSDFKTRNLELQETLAALNFQQAQYEKLASQKKSSEVRTGRIVEQLSPFLENYPLPPETACFLGQPIDFIHFDEDKITFVEVKSGKSQLSKKQRQIRDLIAGGKVDFTIYRIEGEDGTD